ncbi:unnamed protein product [Linum trigynum]|uniref:Fungal lipase-type domain-containing protein n=1 Tax=Linum trigynum TaxID=586398 RepID=A0AAV2GS74_9ROSI
MESIQRRVESWISDQRAKILKVSWGPLHWRMKWPPWINDDREQRKKIHQEYEFRKRQLHDLCLAVKADSISDLQDILCCMVLAECVYKRPATELVRAVNKFKADFGGQVVSLERVQPSSDHVPHRYLLAEAGDTLFASFIGTKQYKDVVADVNIFQGAIFQEDATQDTASIVTADFGKVERPKASGEHDKIAVESKSRQQKDQPKPAAHRGFLARAKGIPALELYKLAQKKNRKLVLCGHSLGGAVAALATLAILRVIAASSPSKEHEKVQVKCITFSQPPVGNAALRDYVHEKGWQHHFKTYCIPEDIVPRFLSPAYFHHYNAQTSSRRSEIDATGQPVMKEEEGVEKSKENKQKDRKGEQLVIGLGPVQTSFWRLSRLVPLEGIRRQFNKYTGKPVDTEERSAASTSTLTPSIEDVIDEPQSLEIQEGSDGISLKPLSEVNNGKQDEAVADNLSEKADRKNGGRRSWQRVPYLPSYVPFGELYLLENSSVELLSGAEYSKLTSVGSVFAELKERFQSHSMRAYRSRFQRIYDLCMGEGGSAFPGMEQLTQFPHLQQWLGLAAAGTVTLAQIVESPVIRTATSILPLGWSGTPGEKNVQPLKVDITGFGLHLCTLVHAQVNGNWCSTTVESFPSAPTYSSTQGKQPELQKIRVLVGAPLRRPPIVAAADSLMPLFSSINSDVNLNGEHSFQHQEKALRPEALLDFSIFCTSDFTTVTKEVHVRTRRVRLLGLEGAGKTSLFKAIMNKGRITAITNSDNMLMEADVQEGIAGGLCYCDSSGVNLQDLNMEVSRFRDELWAGIRDLSRKVDLIVLVHNLSHKIPLSISDSTTLQQQPVLGFLLEEAKALGIPWVLAITNKFSVSAHQQKAAIDAVLQAYQASPSSTEVINSCPYVLSGAGGSAPLPWAAIGGDSRGKVGGQRLFFSPINLVRRPFQRRDTVIPVDGVSSLCQLVQRVLQSNEEAALEELARDRLLAELVREQALGASGGSEAKESSMTAAAVGASVGAGLGLVLAVVMGAASALRKP